MVTEWDFHEELLFTVKFLVGYAGQGIARDVSKAHGLTDCELDDAALCDPPASVAITDRHVFGRGRHATRRP